MNKSIGTKTKLKFDQIRIKKGVYLNKIHMHQKSHTQLIQFKITPISPSLMHSWVCKTQNKIHLPM